MKAMARPVFSALLAFATVIALFSGLAAGKASHKGWPKINGLLKMHSTDRSGRMHGTGRSDELLGGHGNDVILGRGAADVIWGDYQPCCQPTHQRDVLVGGHGRDHIYASHGHNRIGGGPARDLIHAHFGRGVINCGSGRDKVYVSHRARPGYRIRNCEKLDYRPERLRK